eukprot:jgi/Botrbrau1/5500/Bobra.27_1s0037.1
MQYGTASRKELYRYRRLRSGGIETPDRERAWQSMGCGMHLGFELQADLCMLCIE